MAKETASATPAPPRTPLKKVELTRNSRALELQNREPGFHYESFSLEPDHPSYIGKKLTRHEIGDQSVGYAVVEPWQVCSSTINEKVRQLDPRTDQGAPIDGTVRYGRQITCRLPDEEFAKYTAVDEARQKQRGQSLFGSPDRLRQPGAVVTTANSENENETFMGLLNRSNHPMPGSA